MDNPNLPAPPQFVDDIHMLKLAREIAMDIRPIDEILGTLEIEEGQWQVLQHNATFKRYLKQAAEDWTSATNTQERVRIKALAMVEESLPEFFARMHDARETLNSKTEILKTVSRLAGVGGPTNFDQGGADKMIVTINLGAEQQVRIERDVTPNTIDGEAQDVD